MATKVKEKGSLKLIPIPQPQHIESVAEQQEQEESENNNNDEYWRKIPYVDIKDLGPGIYAGMKMEKLLKPWQKGGHRHDFCIMTRPSHPNDLVIHYEFGEDLKVYVHQSLLNSETQAAECKGSFFLESMACKILQRHNRLVYALENWRQLQFLKDEMMIQIRKLHTIESEQLRKQIRLDQLYYEKSLRWPLSPLASRISTSSEDTSAESPTISEVEPVSPPGSPAAIPQIAGSEAGSDMSGILPTTKTKEKKRLPLPPRIRYSLFQPNILVPQPPTPSTRSTSPEEPREYSSPFYHVTPASVARKALTKSTLAQEVIELDKWDEKHGEVPQAKPKTPPAAKRKK
ncbi:unnamed protein product [Sphagnum jensenii]|uniref:Uncharacterized protein n=1 Tax=Sphagnum jensenii TaxID=128206 RepID=A0ABP0W7M0_9BRYO